MTEEAPIRIGLSVDTPSHSLKYVEIIGECWGGKFSSFLDHLAPNGISFRFVY